MRIYYYNYKQGAPLYTYPQGSMGPKEWMSFVN